MDPSRIDRVALTSLAIALVAWVVCYVHFRLHPAAFFRGYLPACLFWAQFPIGSMALVMIHRLTGGGWGECAGPGLRAGAATLPLNLLLFVPVMLGLGKLYPWVAPDTALAQALQKMPGYLHPNTFLWREAAVFLVWLMLAAGLRVWSLPQPPSSRAGAEQSGRWHALGLIAYTVAASVFGIDWVMSLAPRWSSTNFGFLMMVGPVVAALAFVVALVCRAGTDVAAAADQPTLTSLRHDLGNLLLAVVMLWAYLEFQQYLAVWYENLPERVTWYLARNHGGWQWVTGAMVLCYAALPFVLLLSRAAKRSRTWLSGAAVLVVAGSLINTYWLVAPSYFASPADFSRFDPAALLATGGLWFAAFLWWHGRFRQAAEEAGGGG